MIDLSLLNYSPDTGLFTWRISRKRARAGVPAGATTSKGYIRICLNGKFYMAHRLAWLYSYDVWPSDDIDHINGVRSDNRLANLRPATRAQNLANMRKHKGALPKGVVKDRNKFQAQITVSGRRKYLGSFATPEQAHAAYCEAAQQAFGAYHRAG